MATIELVPDNIAELWMGWQHGMGWSRGSRCGGSWRWFEKAGEGILELWKLKMGTWAV
ncbi:hypothetical protein VFPPC_15319 [Pochonia chlamydosporia 170]|uniref:Uncharacterized protein n=1 Tax=Pochonia chlamydosporia 170 TaxID=1380566 RepID=A0A179G807_METCM|nr:hypothetical protein VFPPC_15319 [Pochonia chlamydosporia 170]OAQ73533.1 hypothetical protein VFPPC_15319 [Pochonia chlamydosporia 170]